MFLPENLINIEATARSYDIHLDNKAYKANIAGAAMASSTFQAIGKNFFGTAKATAAVLKFLAGTSVGLSTGGLVFAGLLAPLIVKKAHNYYKKKGSNIKNINSKNAENILENIENITLINITEENNFINFVNSAYSKLNNDSDSGIYEDML